jgi:hypothetical protein
MTARARERLADRLPVEKREVFVLRLEATKPGAASIRGLKGAQKIGPHTRLQMPFGRH